MRERAMLEVAVSAYAHADDDRGWLEKIVRAAAPRMDAGLGVMGWTFRPPHFMPENVVGVGGAENLVEACLATTAAMAAASSETLSRAFTAPRVLDTASELARRSVGVDVDELPGFVEHAHPAGLRDFLGVRAICPSGVGVCLGAPLPAKARTKRSEREAWMRPAAHVLSGLRLRSNARPPSLDDAEAILEPGGGVVHAREGAVDERAALRRAAVAFDRARARRAQERPDEALEAFRALVSGRWSVVDVFDTDGRRFLVACKNDPDVPGHALLTRRETQVACYVALGHPLKYISYELGVPIASVGRDVRAAVAKLGLRAPAELVSLLAPFAPPSDG
ncbi:MAG: hypothetical protein JST00_03745 [Deltaproteobacteria bacterium]|nr:hypothetical protein [Deltaproteobacteria bacterium]